MHIVFPHATQSSAALLRLRWELMQWSLKTGVSAKHVVNHSGAIVVTLEQARDYTQFALQWIDSGREFYFDPDTVTVQ